MLVKTHLPKQKKNILIKGMSANTTPTDAAHYHLQNLMAEWQECNHNIANITSFPPIETNKTLDDEIMSSLSDTSETAASSAVDQLSLLSVAVSQLSPLSVALLSLSSVATSPLSPPYVAASPSSPMSVAASPSVAVSPLPVAAASPSCVVASLLSVTAESSSVAAASLSSAAAHQSSAAAHLSSAAASPDISPHIATEAEILSTKLFDLMC